MTKKFLLLALALSAVMLAADRAWPQAPKAPVSQPQFTVASLNGVCGFTAASTNIDPSSGGFLLPRAAVGTINFDGLGHATIVDVENHSGSLRTGGPEGGVYSVSADGRTGNISFNGVITFAAQFEIVNSGAEIRFVNTGPIDPTAKIIKEVTIGTCKF
jgi:hypothetical protein